MALVAAGADVHCKNDDGYGAGRCMAGQLESGPFADGDGGEGLGSADCLRGTGVCLAAQVDCPALGFGRGAHGDGKGAGGGGRGRALQEQPRVR
jgi:hypothetical protein